MKTIFLDVDGTLVNFVGQIPGSARQAIQEAREIGHRVFLCTGRSLPELWPEILEIGFDGLIAGSGAYVQVGEDILVHRALSLDDIAHVQDFFAANGIDYFLQADDGIYAPPGLPAHLGRLIRASVTDDDLFAELERGLFNFIHSIRPIAQPMTLKVTKIIYVDSPLSLDEIRTEFDTLDVIPSSVSVFGANSGEMSGAGVHKASGIDAVLEHLKIDPADTLAIGDSHNDIEMLAHVAVGIAMGDAPEEVRKVADELTAGVDQDGVFTAFRRHGLLRA